MKLCLLLQVLMFARVSAVSDIVGLNLRRKLGTGNGNNNGNTSFFIH